MKYEEKAGLLEDNDEKITTLNKRVEQLKRKQHESEKIEEGLLNDLQDVKDEKLKLESAVSKKDEEIVELKKRIKILRRDMLRKK